MKIVFNYAKEYLKSKGISGAEIGTITDTIKSYIELKGYHIIEMDEIPSTLPANPSRREMILFLRTHFDEYRFADFRDKNDIEIKKIIHELNSQKKL